MSIRVQTILPLCTALFFLVACGPPSTDDITYRQEGFLDSSITGEIIEPVDNSTTAYNLRFGPQAEESIHYRFQYPQFVLQDDGHISLLLEVYDVVRFVYTSEEDAFTKVENYPQFSLEFFSDISSATGGVGGWTRAEFDNYFAPGSMVPIGSGIGEMTVGIRLPEAMQEDLPTSMSCYLDNPSGELEVLNVIDYEYEIDPLYPVLDPTLGVLVEARLNASVGRYDWELDEMDGEPGYRTSDEVLLRDFYIRFFVPIGE